MIDFELIKRIVRQLLRNRAVAFDLSIIAHPFEQAVGDTGRSAATFGNFICARLGEFRSEKFCRTENNRLQSIFIVERQTLNDTETIAKRGIEQPRASRCADERERSE